MNSLYAFILIVAWHWIADFIFQDEKWALGKSKALKPLLKHTIVYSLLWYLPIFMVTSDVMSSLYFMLITFVAHTVTDYFTSKAVSKKFAKNELGSSIPNIGAFTYIGFDQVLHYVQLVLTWELLIGFI